MDRITVNPDDAADVGGDGVDDDTLLAPNFYESGSKTGARIDR